MFDIRKFGAYVSALRKRTDMTQSELAEKLYLTRQAVSKYERGISFPDISILTAIAEIFLVTVDNLIYAGEPTETEAQLLLGGKSEKIDSINSIGGIINIAPLLKINPAALEKISAKFMSQGIDISNIVNFTQSLTDENLAKLHDNGTYDTVDEELLVKLLPVMNDNARMDIMGKIIEGEVHYRVLRDLFPYIRDTELATQIEAAVVEGALDIEALSMLSWDDDE